jgi:hypothetical protein
MPACCERSARTAGELKCSKALNCVPVGRAEVGAKNEAFFSGRVPHVRPSVHGLKTDSSNALTLLHEDLALGRSLFANVTEAMEGAAPRLFRPMYAEANMGHPSREEGFFVGSNRTVIPTLWLHGRESYESS